MALAAATRAAAGDLALLHTVSSVLSASKLILRASSWISLSSFGLPAGLPDWPFLKVIDRLRSCADRFQSRPTGPARKPRPFESAERTSLRSGSPVAHSRLFAGPRALVRDEATFP